MDLLFKRYANPYFFINGMIQSGRFNEFVVQFVSTKNTEEAEEMQWQFYLHKVFDMSYQDYIAEVENNKKNMSMTKRTIETTVQHSIDILNKFSPDERGGELNGFV